MTDANSNSPQRYLVTGGGGFLGFAIVRQLLERGASVRSVSRGDYPQLAAAGVEHIRGDLADPGVARRAVDGDLALLHRLEKVSRNIGHLLGIGFDGNDDRADAVQNPRDPIVCLGEEVGFGDR